MTVYYFLFVVCTGLVSSLLFFSPPYLISSALWRRTNPFN